MIIDTNILYTNYKEDTVMSQIKLKEKIIKDTLIEDGK